MLAELMAVVAILHVGAIVAVPNFVKYTRGAGDSNIDTWSVTLRWGIAQHYTVLGFTEGDPPFDVLPTFVIDNVLGIATVSSDTSGDGAGNGTFIYTRMDVQAIGEADDESTLEVTKAEFRDKLGNLIDVTSEPGTVTLVDPPPVPAFSAWTSGALAATLSLLVLALRWRRRLGAGG